eukprot:7169811-Pyramimonas_sp.AAC.1
MPNGSQGRDFRCHSGVLCKSDTPVGEAGLGNQSAILARRSEPDGRLVGCRVRSRREGHGLPLG